MAKKHINQFDIVTFIALQDAIDTLKFPTSSEAIDTTDPLANYQQLEYVDYKPIKADRVKAESDPTSKAWGSATISIADLPSGIAGTPPQQRNLLKSHFTETITAGVKVKYDLANDSIPMSIWQLYKGRQLIVLQDAHIKRMPIPIARKQHLAYKFEIEYAQERRASVCLTAATVADQATSVVLDATYKVKNHCFPGQKFMLTPASGTASQTAAVTITAIDETLNSITFAAVTIVNGPMPIGSTITPWLPTPAIVGKPISCGDAGLYIAAEDVAIDDTGLFAVAPYTVNNANLEISFENGKPNEEAITGSINPDPTLVTMNIMGKATFNLVLLDEHLPYFKSLETDFNRSLGVKVGKNQTAGRKIRFAMPRNTLKMPKQTEKAGALSGDFETEMKQSAGGIGTHFSIIYE